MKPPFIDFPLPILTPRLILRPPTLSTADINGYVEAIIESIKEIRPWLPWAKSIPTKFHTEEYIKACNINWKTKENNNIGLPFWLIDKTDGKFLGNIVIWNISWEIPKFEFGYWLRTSKNGQGYITEAVNALTRYAILQVKASRIEIKCEVANLQAKQVAKRLGFNLDGIMPNATRAVATGDLADVAVYSRIDIKNLPGLEVNWG